MGCILTGHTEEAANGLRILCCTKVKGKKTFKFLGPTNALIYTYKMLMHTVKISRAAPTCFGPFGPSSGSYR
jgi:hypothetical protein